MSQSLPAGASISCASPRRRPAVQRDRPHVRGSGSRANGAGSPRRGPPDRSPQGGEFDGSDILTFVRITNAIDRARHRSARHRHRHPHRSPGHRAAWDRGRSAVTGSPADARPLPKITAGDDSPSRAGHPHTAYPALRTEPDTPDREERHTSPPPGRRPRTERTEFPASSERLREGGPDPASAGETRGRRRASGEPEFLRSRISWWCRRSDAAAKSPCPANATAPTAWRAGSARRG